MAWWDKLGFGKAVDKALAALPQTAKLDIFTISGGRILVTQLVGEVTTNIGAVANSTRFTTTPTALAEQDLCAAGTDINGHLVGRLYGMTGVVTDTMLSGIGMIPGQTQPLIVAAGVISIRCLGSDGGGGRVKYTLKWVPVDEAANVVAA